MRRLTVFTGIKMRAADKALMRRAAEIAEVPLSDLIRRATLARARRIIRENENAGTEVRAM